MFNKAERKKAKLKLALTGPSGSGKTMSALLLAKGLGKKIAVLDTENGSAELYSQVAEYDVATIEPPFTPKSYITGIQEAEKQGYDVLIIDSLSHEWAGTGGILQIVEATTKTQRGGNSFTAWKDASRQHNQLLDAILQSNMNIIVTMRSKTGYEMVTKNGKTVPLKIGMQPIQREGTEYEFTVVFDLTNEDHSAKVTKDRTQLFDGEVFIISEDTGKKLKDWMESGKTVDYVAEIKNLLSKFTPTEDQINRSDLLKKGVSTPETLTENESKVLITKLQQAIKQGDK